ncbi:precorrin-2 dehydrogenase/sirohydrochlorin ferrochelatase [Tumebacillus sp. BK434]|nr:precorrin-2 dehydrogenase/sirohydrochlorin ferrochelatase [Tumebacillus sp. BK434]
MAERKITGLLDCQADVTVIAPSLTPPLLKLAEHGTLQWKARPYRAGDAAPFFLIIAATSSRDVNRAVCAEGEQHGRLVNVVNDQSIGNLTVPALLRRGPLTVGISTSGAAPVVAKKLREELEAFFGPEIQQFLHLMADARTRILAEVPDGAERADLLRKLANSELLQLLRAGRTAEAHELLERILGGRG